MALILTSLKKAILSLEKAIKRTKQNPDDLELRDAVIQRFEYTYELSWKMLKRQLEKESASPTEVDTWSFHDLLRFGLEKGFIQNIEKWMEYRQQRNITSHTYDEAKAAEVYQTALHFVTSAKQLYKKLEQRNEN